MATSAHTCSAKIGLPADRKSCGLLNESTACCETRRHRGPKTLSAQPRADPSATQPPTPSCRRLSLSNGADYESHTRPRRVDVRTFIAI